MHTKIRQGLLGLSLLAQISTASAISNEIASAPEKEVFYRKSPLFGQFTKDVQFNFPGLQVSSLVDAKNSTGATLFYFPTGGSAHFDSRGGSVAAIETTLLEEGSYSNVIDGIVFSGGSTMGLAATDGVRKRIFDIRSKEATDFDFIPSVPGAVVYDYGGRTHAGADLFKYPTAEMGEQLMDHLSDTFLIGRAGAGLNTTSGKGEEPIFGGQGFKVKSFKNGVKIAVAVVVNASGEVILPNGQPLADSFGKPKINLTRGKPVHGQNTTLSIVITNVTLDRNALKRLAVMVHTSMAAVIRPFHTPYDGDILFTVSVPDPKNPLKPQPEDDIGEHAIEMMAEAIIEAGQVANLGPK